MEEIYQRGRTCSLISPSLREIDRINTTFVTKKYMYLKDMLDLYLKRGYVKDEMEQFYDRCVRRKLKGLSGGYGVAKLKMCMTAVIFVQC